MPDGSGGLRYRAHDSIDRVRGSVLEGDLQLTYMTPLTLRVEFSLVIGDAPMPSSLSMAGPGLAAGAGAAGA
jgi:hypothetical protein